MRELPDDLIEQMTNHHGWTARMEFLGGECRETRTYSTPQLALLVVMLLHTQIVPTTDSNVHFRLRPPQG